MFIRKGFLILILVVLLGAALYSTFWFMLYAAAENGPGYNLDRTPGDRYFLEAGVEWLLAAFLFYLLLKTKKPK